LPPPTVVLTVALGLALALVFDPGIVNSMDAQQLPNNLPHPNPKGQVGA